MRNFTFDFRQEDYRIYHPTTLISQGVLLHKYAKVVFSRLLCASELPFSAELSTGLSKSDRQFVSSLIGLIETYQELEIVNPSLSTNLFSTTILYEYHPYIELLLEFFIQQHGCSIIGEQLGTSTGQVLEPCTRMPPKSIGLSHGDHSIFSLAKSVLEMLNPLNMSNFIPVVGAAQKSGVSQKRLMYAQKLVCDMHAFFCSKVARRYLILREKTYSRVFNKTIQYAESIVERYSQCSMVMTELRFAGECWDDDAVRFCAHLVGIFMSTCFKKVKESGVLGHAWRLDTVLGNQGPQNFIGNTVWRVRWLTFHEESELGPAFTGDDIATILRTRAEEALAGISSSPSFSSAVIKDLTKLSVQSQPVSGSSDAVVGYKQLIEQWVYELSMGEIYHRIRILDGGRPMMCGRGHPSDGRPKKQRSSKKAVSRSNVEPNP